MTSALQVLTIATPELGDRSYLAHDGDIAVVIDPQRDLDRVLALLQASGARLGCVLETHIHNDYVSGGRELARLTGAAYVVPAGAPIAFSARQARDGDRLGAGSMTLRVVATPGHTDAHLAYILEHDGAPVAVFSGGSLLYGSVGRTDLVDPARSAELTRAQYRSARRLAELLPDDVALHPTHGFGSFCSSGATSGAATSTIGAERMGNDALVAADEDSFVQRLLAGLAAYPRYYAHMSARNLAGAGPADLTPPAAVGPEQLRARIDAGEWAVDLRPRSAHAAGHVPGAIGIELAPQFATYLGWLLPWGTPLTLIADTPDQIHDAQRQLVRIGIDRPAGAATGPAERLAAGRSLAAHPRATFADLAAARRHGGRPAVLDVRRHDEHAASALPDSIHIPLPDLTSRLDELPARPLWVHCASGFRAGIAASLLHRAGHDVTLIDDAYANAAALTTRPPPTGADAPGG